jgi:hypothetical protein
MKIKLYMMSFAIIIAFVIYIGCSENSQEIIESENNEVVFEDLSLNTNVSPNFYDNHFYLVEKLGNNKERETIINTAQEKGVDLNTLNVKDVKKFYLNNTDILMYSISMKESEKEMFVYQYDDLYQISIIDLCQIGNKQQFTLKTLDNQLVYSLQLDNENRMGNFVREQNSEMKTFSNDIYDLRVEKYNLKITTTAVADDDCCRHESGWSDCVDCSVEACGKSWACVVSIVASGSAVVAGFAVSCIGAGPSAWC